MRNSESRGKGKTKNHKRDDATNSRKERAKVQFNGIFSGRNKSRSKIPMIKSKKNLLSPKTCCRAKSSMDINVPTRYRCILNLRGNKILTGDLPFIF